MLALHKSCHQLQLLQTTPPLPLHLHPKVLLLPAQVDCAILSCSAHLCGMYHCWACFIMILALYKTCRLQLLQTTPLLPIHLHPQLLLLSAQVDCVILSCNAHSCGMYHINFENASQWYLHYVNLVVDCGSSKPLLLFHSTYFPTTAVVSSGRLCKKILL